MGDFCAVPGVQPKGIHVVDTEPLNYILSPTFCEMSKCIPGSWGNSEVQVFIWLFCFHTVC